MTPSPDGTRASHPTRQASARPRWAPWIRAPWLRITSQPAPAPAQPPPDPGKPAPNDGRARPTDKPKLWYAKERVLLPSDWRDVGPSPWFTADRYALMGRPGFHIIGICPRCRHKTASVCATEYLSDDVDGDVGTYSGQAAVPAGQGAAERTIAALPGGANERPDDSLEAAERVRPGKQRLQADHQRLRRKQANGTPGPGGPKTQVTVLRCACAENHVPATPGDFGCGSEWLLQVEYDDSSQLRLRKTYISVVDPEKAYRYWPAADAAATEVSAVLTTAQSAAKNWAGALTAILGLIGIGTLLGSRATIQGFGTPIKILFGILAFIAVLADGVMLYQSDLATFGWPSIREALKPSDQWNADLDPLTQANASVRKLRRSVRAAAISAVAALAAVGILLFAPAVSAPAKAKVGYIANGVKTVTSCGTVTFPSTAASSQQGSFLTFTPDVQNGKPQSISLSMVIEIDAC